MSIMRRTLAVSAILLLACSFVAIAQTAPRHRFANPLLDDVVQMTRAGLPDASIEAYIQARQARLSADVTADDLVRLRDSGVSSAVVSYLAGAAGLQNWKDTSPQQPRSEAVYEAAPDSGSENYPVDVDSSADSYWYGWGYGYPYWYGWYGYPYWSGWWGYPYYYGYGHGGWHGGHGGWHGGHGGHGGGHGGHGGGHGGHGGGHGGHGGGHGGGHR